MKLQPALFIAMLVAPFILCAQQQAPGNYFGLPKQATPAETEQVVIKREKGVRYQLPVFDITGRLVLKKELDSAENGLSSCKLKKGSYTYSSLGRITRPSGKAHLPCHFR